MAKLTARGATVVAKVKVVTEAGTKMQYALRSDGKVLVKWEQDGWTIKGALKGGVDDGKAVARLLAYATRVAGDGGTAVLA